MDPSQFTESKTGDLVVVSPVTVGSHAFVPPPLPPAWIWPEHPWQEPLPLQQLGDLAGWEAGASGFQDRSRLADRTLMIQQKSRASLWLGITAFATLVAGGQADSTVLIVLSAALYTSAIVAYLLAKDRSVAWTLLGHVSEKKIGHLGRISGRAYSASIQQRAMPRTASSRD